MATTEESLATTFSAYNPQSIVIDHEGAPSSLLLRFIHNNVTPSRIDELRTALQQRYPDDLIISDMVEIDKPAVFIRNITHISEGQLKELLADTIDSIESIQMIGRAMAKDKAPSMAVCYFNSQEKALSCVKKLHNMIVGEDETKISVSYRYRTCMVCDCRIYIY